MICQDCQGRGYPAFAPAGAAMPCRMCGGSGIASCCKGPVGTAADVPGNAKTRGRPPVEQRRIPMGLRVTPQMRCELVKRAEATGRSITQQMEMLLEQALLMDKLLGQTVVLQLSAERRLLLQQELYHAVHTLEAQARVAKAGSTRQRTLTRRAADLRSVADQLA